jgi:choline kinase
LSVINQLASEGAEITTASIEGLGWAEMDVLEDVARNLELTERWVAAEAVA